MRVWKAEGMTQFFQVCMALAFQEFIFEIFVRTGGKSASVVVAVAMTFVWCVVCCITSRIPHEEEVEDVSRRISMQ